jgi:hypothetical protein
MKEPGPLGEFKSCLLSLWAKAMDAKIVLPARVFEQNLASYINQLLEVRDCGRITLDFRRIAFFTPGAVVGTLAIAYAWHGQGRKVFVQNHESNPVCGYLQRIDFFKQIGLELPEPGTRRNASGRFMPVEMISDAQGDAAQISSTMAECVAPGGYLANDAYQFAQYACGETITNCKQHSGAIADCGIGILKSFEEKPFSPLLARND